MLLAKLSLCLPTEARFGTSFSHRLAAILCILNDHHSDILLMPHAISIFVPLHSRRMLAALRIDPAIMAQRFRDAPPVHHKYIHGPVDVIMMKLHFLTFCRFQKATGKGMRPSLRQNLPSHSRHIRTLQAVGMGTKGRWSLILLIPGET